MTLPVTAIIVSYHSDAVLPQCVASLKETQEIIVSNNGGTTQLPNITFLNNRKNLGFGRAINRALTKVKTPYVLLINPDAVLKPGALQTLLNTAEQNPDAAIISPLLEDAKGEIHTGWRLGHFLPRPCKVKQYPEATFCAGHIAAAVWLVKMEALKKIGLFDKHIFLFFEDDDYTLRTRNAGFSLCIEPAARALHLQGKSSPASARAIRIKNYHYAFSDIYFTRKHRGRFRARLVFLRILFNNFFRLLGGALRLNKNAMLAAAARIAGAVAAACSARRHP